jgi:glucose-6-phosphate isomerase
LGILWGINSFDQPGVELGKQLARPINLALMKGGQIDGELIDPITTNRVNYFKSRAVSPTV